MQTTNENNKNSFKNAFTHSSPRPDEVFGSPRMPAKQNRVKYATHEDDDDD